MTKAQGTSMLAGPVAHMACLQCDAGLLSKVMLTLRFSTIWWVLPRLRSWTHPSNPGLTAAEVMTAPFFTKRTSMRTVVRGGSARYASWTQPSRSRRSYLR